MARHNETGVSAIYDLHNHWLVDVLGPGDSLLTPGARIWTEECLNELVRDFIGQPDTAKDKKFLVKLRDQLAHCSPEAVQLMAELHVVHFLIIWNGAISAAKKRSDLEAILSWMPQPSSVPDEVSAAMAPGLVHPGQWVKTRRDTQLTWLIEFSLAWKKLSAEEQMGLTEDPWALKGFASEVHAPGDDGARLALLHLAHPDTFEAIVSPAHKSLIVGRFDEPPTDEDIDKRLLAARSRLADEYGPNLDWYEDPLLYRWLRDTKVWTPFIDWIRAIRGTDVFDEWERTYKLEIANRLSMARRHFLDNDDQWSAELRDVFQQHPNNLSQWQRHDRFLKWLVAEPEMGGRALTLLWGGGEDPVLQLENFLEVVPSEVLATVGDQLNIGSFLLMAEGADRLPPLKVEALRSAWKLAGWAADKKMSAPQLFRRALVFLDEIQREGSGWPMPLRDRLDAQGAIWGALKWPDRPPSWPEDRWSQLLAYRKTAPEPESEEQTGDEGSGISDESGPTLVDHIEAAAHDLHVDRAVLDEVVDLLEDKGQVIFYGPPGTGKTYFALRLARAIAGGDPDRVAIVQFHPASNYEDFFEGLRPAVTDGGQVTYKLTEGPLVLMAERARSDAQERTYILVIDEINRANLPKVLGELLFLLEYRNESANTLYRPQTPFRLPPNLWFIGTMNTADRSIALIDAAMRRRFHFVPFFPHEGPMKGLLAKWLEEGGGRAGVAGFLDAINDELLGLVGEHLLIGPSHFMSTDLSDKALERIWTYNVFPLIEEQLWGDREEISRWRWDAVRKRFAAHLGVPPEETAQAQSDPAEEGVPEVPA